MSKTTIPMYSTIDAPISQNTMGSFARSWGTRMQQRTMKIRWTDRLTRPLGDPKVNKGGVD